MVNIMMGLDINLDYQSRIPIYEQIVNNIEKYVAVGILREKSQIPSIRELANNLGINPNTVKKAYDILENKIDKEINLIKDKIRELENMGISKKEIMKRIEK